MNRCLCALLLAAALGGCGGASLWPFGEPGAREIARKPANATEYRCSDGKSFYVRDLDATAVWLIAPDREIRLDRKREGQWAFGRVTLEVGGESATLTDPPAVMSACKRAA